MTDQDFCKYLDQCTEPIKGLALKLTRNEEDADDLWQDSVIKAYVSRKSFKPGTNFKAWMYTILRNTFITRYHQNKAKATIIDDSDNLHLLHSGEQMIENGAMHHFLTGDLEKAIADLPDNIRKVINLRRRGFKYHEIAERMKLPLGSVKNKIFLARESLRKALVDYELSV